MEDDYGQFGSSRHSKEVAIAGSDNWLNRINGPSTLPAELPRQFSHEGDVFGLVEIDDTYEKALAQTYEQAINLCDNVVPKQDSKMQKAWAKGQRVELPAKAFGRFLSYQMAAERNPKTNAGFIHFFRSDDTKQDKGFTIHKNKDGHVALKDINRGDTDLSNDESYGEMIDKATRWIHEYAKQFGFTPEGLNVPLIKEAKHQRAAKFILNKLEKINKPRLAKRALALSLGAAVFIGGAHVVSAIIPDHKSPKDPQAETLAAQKAQLARNVKFDKKNLHLPENTRVFKLGEKGKIDFVPDLSDDIYKNAPLVYGPVHDSKEMVGGVRRLSWQSAPVRQDGSVFLGPGACITSEAELGPGATARVVTTDASSADALEASFNRNSLSVCNMSLLDINRGFDHIYFEITNPK